MLSNHPYKFNPMGSNGYPMTNNGFGYPILDFIGGDPKVNVSYNQDPGNSLSGVPAGYTDLYSGRYRSPFAHHMPGAYKVVVSEDDFYLKDRPFNIWAMTGTHILQRLGLFQYAKSFGGTMNGHDIFARQGRYVLYGGVAAIFKYKPARGQLNYPTSAPPLNTTGEITIFEGPEASYGSDPPISATGYWAITFYLGFNVHHEYWGDDVNHSDPNAPGEWTLFTSTTYSGVIDSPDQYLVYKTGELVAGDNSNPFGTKRFLQFKPYQTNKFVGAYITQSDSADGLWFPPTIRVSPYQG